MASTPTTTAGHSAHAVAARAWSGQPDMAWSDVHRVAGSVVMSVKPAAAVKPFVAEPYGANPADRRITATRRPSEASP